MLISVPPVKSPTARLLAAVSLCGLPTIGMAQTTLGPAVYSGSYGVSQVGIGQIRGQLTHAGTTTITNTPGGNVGPATFTATTSPSPDPSVSLTSSVSVNQPNTSATAYAGAQLGANSGLLTYQIEFTGPTSTVAVQVNATLNATMSAFPASTQAGTNFSTGASFWVGTDSTNRAINDLILLEGAQAQAQGSVPVFTTDVVYTQGHSTPLSGSTSTGFSGSIVDTQVCVSVRLNPAISFPA